jgi:NADH-quinone oxidoreductase subunit K
MGSSVDFFSLMSFQFMLFGTWGLIVNELGHIYRLICIEFVILSFVLLFVCISFYFDPECISQLFVLFIIGVAAAESVVGLTILLTYYRVFISKG